MISKITMLLLFFLISNNTAFSQNTPKIPIEYVLDKKEDYKPYETKVIELIHWLDETPIGTEPKDRAAAIKFVFDWINGCPYLTVALHEKAYNGLVHERYLYASELVMAYQFGMTLYILTHKGTTYKGTESSVQEIGIRKMSKAYAKAKNKPRSPFIEKFQKMIQKKKLNSWVKKNVKFGNIKVQNIPTNKNDGKRT